MALIESGHRECPLWVVVASRIVAILPNDGYASLAVVWQSVD